MIRRPLLLLHGPVWDGPAQLSKHHLVRYWAGTDRGALYVESPFHPLSAATRPEEVRRMWKRFVQGPVEVESRLWVKAFPALFPYRAGWPGVGSSTFLRWNYGVWRSRLADQCRKLGMKRPVVVVGTATALPLLEPLRPTLTVYHCSDDYTRQEEFPESFGSLERKLADRCDLVVCTAEELRRAKEHLHPEIHTVTNGAEVKHFLRARDSGTPTAPEVAALPRPRVGYVGTVFRWLDQEMLKHAAQELPGWSFVLVGPVTTDVSSLQPLANVHLLGPRPYEELPSYVKGFDVAVVPFVVHDVTLRASPVKFYEYLASGTPIVATRLPDLEPFRDLAELVRGPGAFTAALERAVERECDALRRARLEEARNHSWASRFAEMERLLERVLLARDGEGEAGPCGAA